MAYRGFKKRTRRPAVRGTRRRTPVRRRAVARKAPRQQTVKVVLEMAPSLGTPVPRKFQPKQTGPR